MNKYQVTVYNDRPGANPYKIDFDYMAASKEEARLIGDKVAATVFGGETSVHVCFVPLTDVKGLVNKRLVGLGVV